MTPLEVRPNNSEYQNNTDLFAGPAIYASSQAKSKPAPGECKLENNPRRFINYRSIKRNAVHHN